jgi:hypothetical protein
VTDVLAVRGAALLGLALVGLALVPAAGARPGPVVRVEGDVARPGWYEAQDLGGAVAAAGGPGGLILAGLPEDGGRLRVEGAYAYPDLAIVAPVSREVGRDPRVSLTHASRAELERLPRVGPVLAERIVAGRPYRSVAQLDRVKGVGPATLAKLRPLVRP